MGVRMTKPGVGFQPPSGTKTAWFFPGTTACPDEYKPCSATLDRSKGFNDFSGRYYGGRERVGMPVGGVGESSSYQVPALRRAWESSLAGNNYGGLVDPEGHDGNPTELERADLAYTQDFCRGTIFAPLTAGSALCNPDSFPDSDPRNPTRVSIPHEDGLWRWYTRFSFRGRTDYYEWTGWQPSFPWYSPEYPRVFGEPEVDPEPPPPPPPPPQPETSLRLLDRFDVEVVFHIEDQERHVRGGVGGRFSERAGWFYMDDPLRPEMTVGMLPNDQGGFAVQIQAGNGPNVDPLVTVTDTETGKVWTNEVWLGGYVAWRAF